MESARDTYRPILTSWARKFFLEADLVVGIAEVESTFTPLRCRFEPGYRYLFAPDVFSRNLGQSLNTEKNQQMTSWGLMQIMGGVARECGFTGYLPELCGNPELGIQFSCTHLFRLKSRFPNGNDCIAAYNAGSPRRAPALADGSPGPYVNQDYVDKVLAAMEREIASRGVVR